MHPAPLPPPPAVTRDCPSIVPTLRIKLNVKYVGGKLRATYDKLTPSSELVVPVDHDTGNIYGDKYGCAFNIKFIISAPNLRGVSFDPNNPLDAEEHIYGEWDKECRHVLIDPSGQIDPGTGILGPVNDKKNNTLKFKYKNFRFAKDGVTKLPETLYRLRLNLNGAKCLDPDPIITNGDGPIKVRHHHHHHHHLR